MRSNETNARDQAFAAMTDRHFVIKRGHRGRYRFALITDGARMTGEVTVDGDSDDRDSSRGKALLRVSALAEALLLSVTGLKEGPRKPETPDFSSCRHRVSL